MEEQLYSEKEHELLDRELHEQLEHKIKRRNRLIIFTCIVIGASLLLAIAFVLLKLFFTVEKIHITGSNAYTEEQLSEVLKSQEGSILPFVSEKEISGILKKNFIFVEKVQLSKKYPDTLEIKVVDEEPLYFYETPVGTDGSMYVVVAKSGKVLDTMDTAEAVAELYPRAFAAIMPEVRYAVKGEKICFKDEKDADYINLISESMKGTVFEQMPAVINVKSRFDIRLYFGVLPNGTVQYEILLGNKQDLKIKLEFAQSILSHLDENFTGIISVEDPKKGFADPR